MGQIKPHTFSDSRSPFIIGEYADLFARKRQDNRHWRRASSPLTTLRSAPIAPAPPSRIPARVSSSNRQSLFRCP
jgi:hypothetical protein